MKGLLSGILLLIFLPGLFGQTYLTQTEYRNKVLEYSYTLKKAVNSIEASESGYRVTRANRLPSVSASGYLNYQFDPEPLVLGSNPVNINNETYGMDLSVLFPLYAGGRLKAATETAYKAFEISHLQKALSEDLVIYQADVTYWNTVALLELLEITRQYLGIVDEQYQLIKDKYDIGAASQTELLLIESRKKEVEILLINSRKSYTMAQQSLNLLMGMDPNAETVLSDSIAVPTPTPADLTLDSILMMRPDYKIAEKTIELREKEIKAAVSSYNPQVNLGLTGSWGTPFINTEGADNVLQSIAFVQLNVPIFQWFERRHVKNQFNSFVEEAENEKKEIIDLAKIELQNSIVDYRESLNQINISSQSLSIANESLDLNTFSYENGRATILDVLQAQLSWIQAYTNNVRAHLNSKIAWANYQVATGNY